MTVTVTTRQEVVLDVYTEEKGPQRVRVLDRITVDDMVLHLMRRELYALKTGTQVDSTVSQQYKDSLIKARNPVL